MVRLDAFGEALGGFRQRLEVAQHGVLDQRRAQKCLPAASGVFLNPYEALPKVDEIELIVLHRGTASRSTRSRMYQCSPSAVTTSTLQSSRSWRSRSSRPRSS